jgi:hypothetical protein
MSAAASNRVSQIGGWTHYGDLWEDLLHRITGTSTGLGAS